MRSLHITWAPVRPAR